MQNQRELFEIERGGRRIAVAVRGARGGRRYIGSIDGQVCAVAREKGELLRRLMEMIADSRAVMPTAAAVSQGSRADLL